MTELFLNLLNMSISASWLVLAIVLFRFLLKKAPKSIICVLWGLVALRLIFPFSIESPLSLIPSEETIPLQIEYSRTPTIDTGINSINNAVNPIIQENFTPSDELTSMNPIQLPIYIGAYIWQLGMIGMLLYAFVSYLRIRIKVRERVKTDKNIYICDRIPSPFILGIIRPKIYLPSSLSEEEKNYVIAHEKAHLKRLDYIRKPLGFILLTIYWFNPILWLAYILLCRDIEYACDEKVVKDMNNDEKKEYSTTLLNLSIHNRLITACPLAFGESGVKSRIKSVLNYKKPAFWVIIVAVILCTGLAVCFLTNPVTEKISGDIVCEYFPFNPLQSAARVPSIRFYENNTFSLSLDSSNDFDYGKYELTYTTLCLYTKNKPYTYIFNIDENTFIFDAEKSSEASGVDISLNSTSVYSIPDDTTYAAMPICYSEIDFDFDKDGTDEKCTITNSNPSIMREDDGIRFVSISKEYMSSNLYSGYITYKDVSPSFVVINDELKIRLEHSHGSVVNYLDITPEGRSLIFSENVELLEGYPEDILNHMIIVEDAINSSAFKNGMNDDILKEYYKQDIEDVMSMTESKHIVISYFDYDFNSDGLIDKFVIIASPLHSGSGGDSVNILINNGDGTYKRASNLVMQILNQHTMEISPSIYISTQTNGYHDIILIGDRTYRLTFDGYWYIPMLTTSYN